IVILLGIIASYAIARIRYLSLPIPSATSIAALVLPILTGLSIQISQSLLTPSRTIRPFKRSLPTWLFPLIFLALTIYDTVLITLASNSLIPSEAQTCLLSTTWEHLFHTHDAGSIGRIQDTHRCCGLRTTRHMPWPFPDNHGADYVRTPRLSAHRWNKTEFFSLQAVFIVLLIYRGRHNPSMQHFRREYAGLINSREDAEDNDAGHGNSVRGRIEAPYRDNVSSEVDDTEIGAEDAQGHDRGDAGPRNGGMVVQPSSMQGAGSEWRT
ncbi:MAG: hypothetical protein Q9226_008366, partial [Calogaya cf. arnoldii]